MDLFDLFTFIFGSICWAVFVAFPEESGTMVLLGFAVAAVNIWHIREDGRRKKFYIFNSVLWSLCAVVKAGLFLGA